MLKYLILVLPFLAACEPRSQPNQCLAVELMKQCLSSVPKGPDSTKYNDWSEVVDSCSSFAYSASRRLHDQIPKECKTY